MTTRQRQSVDALVSLLSSLSADHSRSAGYYGNVVGAPGPNSAPRRVLSSIGFLESTQYQLVAPNATHVSRGETDRPCALIRILPYGLREDSSVLLSPVQHERRRIDAYALGNVCVQDIDTTRKTVQVIERMTGEQGPAYHFIVDRRGGIYVCATLDDTIDPASPLSIDIALEGALVAPEKSWRAGHVTTLFELPLTSPQSDTLATLIAKLWTAYPTITRDFTPTGITVVYQDLPHQTELFNFTDGAWRTSSEFDHSNSDIPGILGAARNQLNFDLATDVFVAPSSRVRAVRAVAATAVYHADTVGARSMLLGHYAELAGLERSQAMQTTSRREFFVQRLAEAQTDALHAANAASSAAGAGTASPTPSVSGAAPSVFDFTTGRWQDDQNPY